MSNDITELRGHLFDTLRGLKNKSIDIEQAKAICEVASKITDTAKVEVDFLRVTESESTGFIPASGETRTSISHKGDVTTVKAFPGLTVTTHKAK